MFLTKAFWSNELKLKDAEESNSGTESSSLLVTLALRSGVSGARAEFSFLRLHALRTLLNFLRSVAASNSTISLFSHSQSFPDVQDCHDQNVANLDRIFHIEPLKIASPSSDAKVALALRVLEGCCLLHRQSSVLAHQHKAIQVLVNILSTLEVLEQGACLDALISIMLDSSSNQMDFEEFNGIEEVALLIRDKQADSNLRLKCGEFLLLLIGHISGRDRYPMVSIHEDIRRLLSEKCATLIWAASQFGSTLDPEHRLTALHLQVSRVLKSVYVY